MPQTFQDVWDELVMKCQYDTGGMNISELQKSVIVWADAWVRAAQQSTHPTPESLAKSQAESNTETLEQSDGDTPPAQAQVA